jgi:hypothetical protein
MKTTFTPEQSALVKRVWLAGGSIKPYLGEMGDKPYTTVVSHALKTLGLGPRPKSDRGQKEYAWSLIEAALRSSPGTVPEIAQRTRLVFGTINKRLNLANAGPTGKVHVVEWEKRSNGGRPVPTYAWGPGENAPMPAPLTTAEKNQRAKRRKKAANNPFASAAGLIAAPKGEPGRVYLHLWDDHEREAA